MNQADDTELLQIVHRTTYSYSFPVTFEPHRLVLRPREGHDLRVESHILEISPDARRVWTWDIFGNSITHAHFSNEPAPELIIESRLVVRRTSAWEESADTSQSSAPQHLAYDPLEHNIITGYLTPVYPEETDALRNWIAEAPQRADFADNRDFVLSLTQAVHDKINYRRRDEKGVQTPATTMTQQSGSCRDMATLLMEALRHQGVAARFASGYLDCAATRAARGSTHAWTEAYLPQRGWVGFDPTTGNPCDHHHVVVGTSHHPRGVMPVSGRFFGPANAFRRMTVGVEFSQLGDGQQTQSANSMSQ